MQGFVLQKDWSFGFPNLFKCSDCVQFLQIKADSLKLDKRLLL